MSQYRDKRWKNRDDHVHEDEYHPPYEERFHARLELMMLPGAHGLAEHEADPIDDELEPVISDPT